MVNTNNDSTQESKISRTSLVKGAARKMNIKENCIQ